MENRDSTSTKSTGYFLFFFVAFLAFFFVAFLAFFLFAIGMCNDSFYRLFGFRESRPPKREQYEWVARNIAILPQLSRECRFLQHAK